MTPAADNTLVIRLRFEDSYIVVERQTETGPYDVRVTDAIGKPVADGDLVRALGFLNRMLSELRKQIHESLNRAGEDLEKNQ